ncbi:MAG: hypothetical protein K8T25_12335 [Planctomycetia bacterium]|nr:hypothetical protein [Planctomycetia bacterium]
MHSELKHITAVAPFLGSFYVVLFLLNAVMAYYLWHYRHKTAAAIFWMLIGGVYICVLSPLALSGHASMVPSMPEFIRNAADRALQGTMGAVVYSSASFLGLTFLYLGRRFFVKWWVAWSGLNLALLALGLSMTNQNFYSIAAKPDNVPIVGLVFLLGFFTWLGTAKAVENDDRAERGLPPTEKDDDEKVLVWPDLVYTELICMIVLTAVLLVWGIGLKAPLEEPASRVKTPNPSKAPWYFLGLQEMLVYYDPWMAGVVLPSVVVLGLMAIPYLDFNPRGNGYYTISQRQFSYLTFQFGFLVLWVTLIVLGTFLRGPNWNIFGPYEYWDPHKVEALNNVNLSQMFWENLLHRPLPKAPTGASGGAMALVILEREWLGIALTLGYLVLLPPIMATTVFRRFFVKMGFIRFMLMSNLMLMMMSLPIKMVLRWTFNLKYIIAIPEFFLNL